MQRVLASERDTLELGAQLAQRCPRGAVIYLSGELGVGKTCLVRGFLRALGHAGAVKSPTFTLVEPYELAGRRLYHFDLYRIASAEELDCMGARDYFDGDAVCLIEWPERGAGALPPADLSVTLSYGERERYASLEAASARGRLCLGDEGREPLNGASRR